MYFEPRHLYLSSYFLSFSTDCLHWLWSLAEGTQLNFRSDMERHKGSVRGLPPSVFLPIRSPWVNCPLFYNSISRDHRAKQWKIHSTMFPHQQCLLSDLHLSFTNSYEYGRWIWANFWGYAKFNNRQACQPWNCLHRQSMDKFGLVGGTLIPEKIPWPLFYVLGRKDQVNAIITTSIKENGGLLSAIIPFWTSIIIHHLFRLPSSHHRTPP